MILDTSIQGIPCQVRVTHYRPAVAPVIAHAADWSDPGSPAEIEFDVLDRRGRRAPWLERWMLSEDTRVIEEQIIAAKAAEAEQDRTDAAADLVHDEWGAWA